jgi:hypothetical protein
MMLPMKGGLTVDHPSGERWNLALDLISDGRENVLLGSDLVIRRDVGWPGADGQIHIGVLASDLPQSAADRAIAQRRVNEARAQVAGLLDEDQRFSTLIDTCGVVWEYLGDDGSAAWIIGTISEDGQIVWSDL